MRFVAVAFAAVMAIAVLLALSIQKVEAAHIPCAKIRKAVSAFGVNAVESWARSNGYSEAVIKQAKRCLK